MINKAMAGNDKIDEFMDFFAQSLQGSGFIKATLGHYKGDEPDLKNIAIRKTLIKDSEKLSFTFRYKTKDIVKNFDLEEGWNIAGGYLENGFHTANLFTSDYDLQLETDKKPVLRKLKPTQKPPEDLSHDRQKNRFVDPARPYLHALGITNEQGSINKNSQDKYRQINKYIEILDGLVKTLPGKELHIADMGSGKGYLTFALYDHLTQTLGKNSYVTGVEHRLDMVDLCNDIAKKSGYENLHFVQDTIEGYKPKSLNVLIALHACDTATDDAIAKGIQAEADLIVVAPCCHKQIRRELENRKTPAELDFLLKHGIFMERQAEMTTDAIRSLILEEQGYSTKVFEFISDAHTPKNVMITAVKTKKSDAQKKAVQEQIGAAKKFFGISDHYLEKALGR